MGAHTRILCASHLCCIHSRHCAQVRRKLVGKTEPSYSQYTCYTGIADFTPPDIDTVGYRVFLGNGQYFVSSDVGGGKMQWCALIPSSSHGRPNTYLPGCRQ